MKKKTKASVKEKSSPLPSLEAIPSHTSPKKTIARKVLAWVGWGIVYVIVFYLGNLTGEYVAAHMPLSSLQKLNVKSLMPNVTLPKISIKWNSVKSLIPQPSPIPPPARTQLVAVGGALIAMPLEASTQEDREQFAQTIKSMAKPVTKLEIRGSCDLSVAFGTLAKQASVEVVNSTQSKHMVHMRDAEVTVEPSVSTRLTVTDEAGIYPLLCDSAIAGFFVVE